MTVDATTSLMNEGITDNQLFIFILKDDFFFIREERQGFWVFLESQRNTVYLGAEKIQYG